MSDKRNLGQKVQFWLGKEWFVSPRRGFMYQPQGDYTKKYFYVHGGAPRTEEATWFSASDLDVIEIECDEDNVDMTSATEAM